MTEFDEGLAAQSDELDPAATHRDDMAFWLYSSGSTGKPKGVVHLQHDIEVTCENYAQGVLGLTRGRHHVLDDEAVPRLRPRQRPLVPAVGSARRAVLMRGRHEAGGDPRDAARATGRRVFFSVPALFGALVRGPGGRRRARVGALLRVGGGGAARRTRSSAGANVSASTSSTGSARPRCSTSTARTGPADRAGDHRAGRFPGTSCGSSTTAATVLEGPAIGALQVRGDSCAAFYWHQHEKTKASMLGDWFAERRSLRAHARTGPTRTSAGSTTC